MMSRSLFAAVFTAMCVLALRADALAVKMLPGECWWGVCNSFGTNMPFTAATQGFKADLFAWDDVGRRCGARPQKELHFYSDYASFLRYIRRIGRGTVPAEVTRLI